LGFKVTLIFNLFKAAGLLITLNFRSHLLGFGLNLVKAYSTGADKGLAPKLISGTSIFPWIGWVIIIWLELLLGV